MPRIGAQWPFYEDEPPLYTCVGDVSVVHEGDEVDECEWCRPKGAGPAPE